MAVMFVFHSVIFGWLSHFLYSGLFGTRKSYSGYVCFFIHSIVFGQLSQLRTVWYKVNKAQGFGSYAPRPFLPSPLVCMQVYTIGGHVVLVDCYLKKASEVNMCETTYTKRTYKTK